MALLYAIAGPLQGAIFRLPTEDVSIGRLPFNQLCVSDPSVSRQHCLIAPQQDGFRIRDLDSNNGTFVNGNRIDDCILADGDKIRIGDTIFRFALKEPPQEEQLYLPDNGVVVNTAVEQHVSASATTAMKKLFETVGRDGAGASRAMTLLKIGAGLNAYQETEALQIDLLKQILEVVPAEQAAIVLLTPWASGEPSVVVWDRRHGQAPAAQVSRTLVSRAIEGSLATFSDDVTSH